MDEYDKLAEITDARMSEIDSELASIEQSDESDEITASNLLKLASNAKELFICAKPATKNQFLRLLLSNCEIEQKRLSFNLLEPFNFIKIWTLVQIWLPLASDFRTACRKYDEEKITEIIIVFEESLNGK